MSVIYTITQSLQTPSGQVVTGSSTQTNGAEAIINETLPINQTDVHYNMAFKAADIKSVGIVSEVATTIKTNSSGAPDDTIVLAANRPLVWDANSPFDCPFSADVDNGVYITNTATGALRFYVLYDPTS